MNMKSNKTNIIIIAAILAVALTSLFLIVKVTALFVVAYVFALLAIALFAASGIYLLGNTKAYPWVAAIPQAAGRYLGCQLVLSAVFVIMEQFNVFALPIKWFLFFHTLLLAFFAILLIMLKSGKDIIEQRDEEVKAKVAALRFMVADAESLLRKYPVDESDIKPVVEALRYSDPMSHASLAVYEEQIQRGIMAIDGSADTPGQCAELLRLIADRNARAKILK
jgi:hypothetical protein